MGDQHQHQIYYNNRMKPINQATPYQLGEILYFQLKHQKLPINIDGIKQYTTNLKLTGKIKEQAIREMKQILDIFTINQAGFLISNNNIPKA